MPTITYLDTSVLISAFEGRGDMAAALTELFVVEPPSSFIPFVTSELTLAELLVKPYRDKNDLARIRYETLIQSSSWMTVLSIDREILAGAALLRSAYRLKLPDAIHLSTAAKAGCNQILTEDLGITGNYELLYDSATQHWRSGMVTVKRPDTTTLSSLPDSWQP